MISVGYEDFPNGTSWEYWDISTAIRSFESSTHKSIREIVAENYVGKTLSQIVREGGSISHDIYWIDFSNYNEASLEKTIAEVKQSIEILSKKKPVRSLLYDLDDRQTMLEHLEYQLKAFRNELPPKPLLKEPEVSVKIIEQPNENVVIQPYVPRESLFVNLIFDDAYKPDEQTLASAHTLACFGYDWNGGEERLLDQDDEMIVKRVLTAGDEDYSNFTVLYLEYYCWICPDKISKIMPDPNMLRKWGTRFLIKEEALLEEDLGDLYFRDLVDWIEAEPIDGKDRHIGTDDVPEYIVNAYIKFIEDNSIEAGSYFEEYIEDEDEEYISKIDPRVRKAFQMALDEYIGESAA